MRSCRCTRCDTCEGTGSGVGPNGCGCPEGRLCDGHEKCVDCGGVGHIHPSEDDAPFTPELVVNVFEDARAQKARADRLQADYADLVRRAEEARVTARIAMMALETERANVDAARNEAASLRREIIDLRASMMPKGDTGTRIRMIEME
jgi:hypothetical protein